jgi:hypothetical protein
VIVLPRCTQVCLMCIHSGYPGLTSVQKSIAIITYSLSSLVFFRGVDCGVRAAAAASEASELVLVCHCRLWPRTGGGKAR